MSDKEDKAAFEKSLKSVTGLTRTEFRDELINFNRAQLAIAAPRPFPSVTIPPEQPAIQVREIKLDPLPLNLESTGQSSTSAPSANSAAATVRFDVFQDGDLVQYDIPATLV